MFKINSALVVYFVALIFYFTAVFVGIDSLELFSKPIIIPAISYFYYFKVKGKIDFLFTISLFSFFCGEILHLLNKEEFNNIGLIFLLFPYFIVLNYLIKDVKYYVNKGKLKLNSFSFYIIIMLLLYLLINLLLMVFEENDLEFFIYFIYGITLLFMGIFSFLLQINFSSKSIILSTLMVINFIISDLFFILFMKNPDLTLFEIINVVTQELSFYWYVIYFINRPK